MGPIIILDKSTFQSLSRREHLFLYIHFEQNLTPILALELLGDLRKEEPGSKSGEEKVAELAEKFGGSGPVLNLDHQTLCVNSLLGNHFALDGRIAPQMGREVRGANGSRGYLIEPSPLNYAILQWSCGQFQEFERLFSQMWRQIVRELDVDSFRDQLNEQHVIIPKVSSFVELQREVDTLLSTASLQDVWLTWLLNQMTLVPECEDMIRARWRNRQALLIQQFSPYSWHCLRVLLSLLGATRHQLLRWQPTNLLDVQYLYYLPFCMVFSSNDRLHQHLAPILLRSDQSFVLGQDLKADLAQTATFRESLAEEQRRMLGFALGSYPPPRRGSIICRLWKKHCRPWQPGMGNQAIQLSEDNRREAIRWVKCMYQEVEAVAGK